jgi:hypothetical protein
MRTLLRKIDRRFRLTRPGSVLILVVALLVLMALIGTAFISTSRTDRVAMVQHTNNTEIDLLLEGVKNMAKATIVGSLNDPSLPFPYRPANSSIAKNWDAYDLYHQYTTDPLIGTTPNDAWLSPRCPTFHSPVGIADIIQATTPPSPALPGLPVWQAIGEPLTGNTFESPFVLPASGTGALVSGVSLTYGDRLTRDFVPPTPAQLAQINADNQNGVGPDTPPGSLLTPTFATLSYPDGTSATFPAFTLTAITNDGVKIYSPKNGFESAANTPLSPQPISYTYLAGDADGDGIADCGMCRLPVGQINGLTYYAGVRIIDNCAAVNVNTAMCRRYDFSGDLSTTALPTRYINGSGVATFSGVYNLGCFPTNVGLAEMLESYDGSADNISGNLNIALGTEFGAWLKYQLGNPGTVASGVIPGTGSATNQPVDDLDNPRADFSFTSLGDMLTSQIGRRPGNPGYAAAGSKCFAFTDTDAADLAYHFLFQNPNTERTPLETALHASLCDVAPNSSNTAANFPTPNPPPPTVFPPGPIVRYNIAQTYGQFGFTAPGPSSTSYTGSPSDGIYAVNAWYAENFDWENDTGLGYKEACTSTLGSTNAAAGDTARPRRSILTANSAVSNLTPQPLLPTVISPPNNLPTSNRPYTVATGMTPITSTMCKTSINTAVFGDLWRAFWLSMAGDYGLSPLGSNTGATSSIGGTGTFTYTAPAGFYDHDLVQGQSIYTGSQWPQTCYPMGNYTLPPADMPDTTGQDPKSFLAQPTMDAQHPQEMFRSTLRNPTGCYYQTTGGSTNWSYIEADQMVLLRSAIAAANVEAMRDPYKGSGANIHAHDIALNATIDGVVTPVTARVFGVSQQPYITEVYANTNIDPAADDDTNTPSTNGLANSVPYVAIELFNPYNQPINLAGWQLAAVDRSPTSDNTRALSTASILYTFPANDVITGQPNILPAATAPPPTTAGNTTVYQGSYALLENLGSGGATYRPMSTGLKATGTVSRASYSASTGGPLIDITVPTTGSTGLDKVIQKFGSSPTFAKQELVLLRPGTNSGTADPVIDQVPVDSFDFTGLTWNGFDGTNPNADVWHYVRGNAVTQNASAPGTNTNVLWRFIYPGRYDASDPTPYAATPSGSGPPPITLTPPNANGEPRTPLSNPPYQPYSRRQQGTDAGHYHPMSSAPRSAIDPFAPTSSFYPSLKVPVTLGGYTSPSSGPNDNWIASYPATFPFQYLNNDEPGASPLVSGGVNAAPFGTFVRNSDMLQVPFVGSYIIMNTTTPSATANGVAPALSATDAANIIEINAMPADCSFAEDTDVSDDPPMGQYGDSQAANSTQDLSVSSPFAWNESVGHFAPVNTSLVDNTTRKTGGASLLNLTQFIGDADPTLSYTTTSDPYTPYKTQLSTETNNKYWRYRWASRIFDYLTVQNPNDDYLPNIQQQIYSASPTGNPFTPTAFGALPQPVQNTASIAPAASPANPNVEDTVPVYGSININTAPWRVVAALRLSPYDDAEPASDIFPLITNGTNSVPGPGDQVPDNTELATAIVTWRDQTGTDVSPQVNGSYPYALFKGPFTSMTDLLNVPTVSSYLSAINDVKTSPEPNDVGGHFLSYVATPPPSGTSPFQAVTNTGAGTVLLTDGVRNDVEERFDLLSRLSNQISVKSDVYTVYIVIQGWRNAGSTSSSHPPQMVTQKRAAFIIDRTGVTPTSSNVKIINVPTN